jgi:Spy/CpxP family protein refolding chaperone
MSTRPWKVLLVCLTLTVPAALHAQGPRSGFFPWWDSPIVGGLDLTDAQRTEIRSVIQDYRGRMVDVRRAVQKAETDLDAVFNEDTVDQRRGAEAIDHLTKARADMTKSVSEMSLRMRAVLTTQQWQELQRRQREDGARIQSLGRGPGSPRGVGRARRVAKAGSKEAAKDAPPRTAESQPQTPSPALSQQ